MSWSSPGPNAPRAVSANRAVSLRCLLATLAVAVVPASVLAHADDGLTAHSLWRAWSFDPWVTIPLAIAAGLYAIGMLRLRRRGRLAGVRTAELAAFWIGWLAAVVALMSPIDALGDQLFSAHMVQHELLMLVAAPLLVLGKPLPVWLWAFPVAWRPAIAAATRRRAFDLSWRMLTRPSTAWIVHAIVLWGWHVPSLFQAAVGDNLVHTAQHLGFMLSALLFWWAMFDQRHGMVRSATGALYIFTTAVHSSILGALMTFSETVWYPVYAGTAPLWGLSPIEDQQLGGLIMWVPGGVVYVVVTLWLFARLLGPGQPARGRCTS